MHNFPAGFELLVTGVRYADSYTMYTGAPESMAHLLEFLGSFQGPVVTFAGARFDLPMLRAWSQQTLGAPLPSFQHYDLLVEIEQMVRHRISLERLCYYTFGEKKVALGHHSQYGRIWETEPWRMIDYNRVDLDLTHELFMRVLRRQPLFLGDSTVVLPLP